MSHKTKTQKRQKKNRSRRQRSRRFFSRKSQRGGSTILSPSNYSNQNNAHISGIGFTDLQGAVRACTGSTSSAAALKGADIFQTIGGVKTPVTVTTGGGLGRLRGRGRGSRWRHHPPAAPWASSPERPCERRSRHWWPQDPESPYKRQGARSACRGPRP